MEAEPRVVKRNAVLEINTRGGIDSTVGGNRGKGVEILGIAVLLQDDAEPQRSEHDIYQAPSSTVIQENKFGRRFGCV